MHIKDITLLKSHTPPDKTKINRNIADLISSAPFMSLCVSWCTFTLYAQ